MLNCEGCNPPATERRRSAQENFINNLKSPFPQDGCKIFNEQLCSSLGFSSALPHRTFPSVMPLKSESVLIQV